MISENKNQNVEVSTVEKKKRNYKKKDTVDAPIEKQEVTQVEKKPKAKPNRSKKQPIETPQNDGGTEMDFEKISNLIDTNPSIAEEFQNILKKHLK